MVMDQLTECTPLLNDEIGRVTKYVSKKIGLSSQKRLIIFTSDDWFTLLLSLEEAKF